MTEQIEAKQVAVQAAKAKCVRVAMARLGGLADGLVWTPVMNHGEKCSMLSAELLEKLYAAMNDVREAVESDSSSSPAPTVEAKPSSTPAMSAAEYKAERAALIDSCKRVCEYCNSLTQHDWTEINLAHDRCEQFRLKLKNLDSAFQSQERPYCSCDAEGPDPTCRHESHKKPQSPSGDEEEARRIVRQSAWPDDLIIACLVKDGIARGRELALSKENVDAAIEATCAKYNLHVSVWPDMFRNLITELKGVPA